VRSRHALFVAVLAWVAATATLRAQDPYRKLIGQWESTFNAGNYEATAALYTADAIRYPPGGDPLNGPDDIVADLQTYAGVKIELTLVGSKTSGDLAVGWGRYVLSGKDADGNAVSESGPWMNVVVKGTDGSWKIYRDIWNSSEPVEDGGT